MFLPLMYSDLSELFIYVQQRWRKAGSVKNRLVIFFGIVAGIQNSYLWKPASIKWIAFCGSF